MADIGAAAGIVGPAIYRHFDGKSAVLVAMFDHVIDDLTHEASEILSPRAATPRPRCAASSRRRSGSCSATARWRRSTTTRSPTSPEEDRHRLRRKQRLYIEEWVHVLAQLRPDASDATVRALVHASVGAIQSVLFYSSGLPDDQLAALMSSVAETSLFAPLLARGTTPDPRFAGPGDDPPARPAWR